MLIKTETGIMHPPHKIIKEAIVRFCTTKNHGPQGNVMMIQPGASATLSTLMTTFDAQRIGIRTTKRICKSSRLMDLGSITVSQLNYITSRSAVAY
jgi:hypothetical protein